MLCYWKEKEYFIRRITSSLMTWRVYREIESSFSRFFSNNDFEILGWWYDLSYWYASTWRNHLVARQERFRGWLLSLWMCRSYWWQGSSQPEPASQCQHSSPHIQKRLILFRLPVRTNQTRVAETRQTDHLLPKLYLIQTCEGKVKKEWNLERTSFWLWSWRTSSEHRTRW